MSELAGLVLFGVVVTFVVGLLIAAIYCGFFMLCINVRPNPLSENENPV